MSSGAGPPRSLPPAHGQMSVVVSADTAALSALRRIGRSFVEAFGGSAEFGGDVELVISELATNVVRHSDASEIRVELERTDIEWTISVANDAALVLDGVDPPRHDELMGRGLPIVHALMDTVATDEHDGIHLIRATRRCAA